MNDICRVLQIKGGGGSSIPILGMEGERVGWHTECGRLAQVTIVNDTIMKMAHFSYKSLVL